MIYRSVMGVVAALFTYSSMAQGKTEPPYKVVNGDQVDAATLKGWKMWRSFACERCHGAQQEGLVGPSLVETLKVLSKDDFHTLMMNGRVDKGMPNFGETKSMQENWENLYAYLKGRSDGAIKPGRLKEIGK